MKFSYLLCLSCLIFYVSSFAQVQENFSDGNFTDTPAWNGNINLWTIANGQLRSNSSVASSSFYLSTPSSLAADAQWEFYVKLSFNTSGTNYVDIFLTSDLADLKGMNNGYFVRIGGSKDEISLYKRTVGINALLIDGVDATTSTTSNSLKIRVSRMADFTWKLEKDKTGTGNSYVSEGTHTDASFTTSGYFGFVVQQSTSSFFNKHFFDDITIAPFDRQAPKIEKVIVLDATHLEVMFSEPVTALSAQTLTNYLADNNIGNPSSVAMATGANGTDPARIILTFANEFVSEWNYTLSVAQIADENNNFSVPETHPFLYKAPFSPQYRDIVINELMADPTPATDLPEAEFIELYNTTDQDINLNGYTLTDGTSTAKFGPVTLAAHSYLIVSSTTYATLFTPFGTVAGVTNFPSLNNIGETLLFKNPAGKILDRVTYSALWYKDGVKDDGGWSLEQINPTASCINSSNWQASIHESGGTPGKQNSVYSSAKDQTAPNITSLLQIASNQIELQFTEPMDSLLLQNGTYKITHDLSVSHIQVATPEFISVRLTLSQDMVPGLLYSITVLGLADCPGNTLLPVSLTFGNGAMPQYGQLLITEIMADETPSVGLPEGEFIELYNPTDQLLSLAGVTLTDDNATAKLPEQLIYPGEYILICASTAIDKFSTYGKVISVSGFSLNNSGESLTLKNSQNSLIYSVKYSPEWYGNKDKEDGGWSLEIIDTQYACVESGNWMASESATGGTPGKVNSVNASKPDLLAPQLVKVTIQDSLHLQVFFNEKLDSANACLQNLYAVTDNKIEKAEVTSFRSSQVQLTLATALLHKKAYTVSIRDIKDCSGNISSLLSSLPFVLPEQADSADIIINEVLFNARTGGVDFVEIFNRSDKYINLKNWQLANISNDSIANLKPVSAEDEILAPGIYKVFTTNSKLLKDHYPQAREENFWLLPSMPSYPDDAGSVILLNNLHKVSDRFDYSENMHFSLIDEVAGVSLERISIQAPTNTSNNWHSAASAAGYATPGYRNSQSIENSQPAAMFSIHPKVFTPDEDGRDDFTTMNYMLNASGNMATIVVFDAQGREIRQIANNQLLAAEGFYTWDGTDQQGQKVRVGRYIIYISTFDMTGKVQHIKETVIVGARF